MPNNFGFTPPVGHPHYLSDEAREALANPIAVEEPVSISPAKQKYKELRDKIVEARKVMEETAKGLFTEMSTELFAENPALISFGWTQYTPYFNDGDACVFSCLGDYPTVAITVNGDTYSYDSNSGKLLINGAEEKSYEDYIDMFKNMKGEVSAIVRGGKTISYDQITKTITMDGIPVASYRDISKLFKPFEKIVSTFMKDFEDEDMLTMFGDHVQVVVHRDDGIETERYEHE